MRKGEVTITEAMTKAMAELAAEAEKQQAPDGAGRYVARIPGPGTFSFPVVGESHYQTALASICGGYTEEGHDVVVEANLVLEDSNPHDPDAVRVDIKGETVGYLSRENARQYRNRLIEEGYPHVVAKCMANIRGGWDRGHGDKGYFGIWLDVPTTG
jgi:hypothetical protein